MKRRSDSSSDTSEVTTSSDSDTDGIMYPDTRQTLTPTVHETSGILRDSTVMNHCISEATLPELEAKDITNESTTVPIISVN